MCAWRGQCSCQSQRSRVASTFSVTRYRQCSGRRMTDPGLNFPQNLLSSPSLIQSFGSSSTYRLLATCALKYLCPKTRRRSPSHHVISCPHAWPCPKLGGLAASNCTWCPRRVYTRPCQAYLLEESLSGDAPVVDTEASKMSTQLEVHRFRACRELGTQPY